MKDLANNLLTTRELARENLVGTRDTGSQRIDETIEDDSTVKEFKAQMRIVSERLVYFKEKLESLEKLTTEEGQGTEELEQALFEAIPSETDIPQEDGPEQIIDDLITQHERFISLFSRKKLGVF
mmetsp:Transcript_12664/g.18958  ORF Transcript_12664/g.18958 Transcript_12664/m.18958 type:complete len:125 (+) Transcript_12664:641-1015(+)